MPIRSVFRIFRSAVFTFLATAFACYAHAEGIRPPDSGAFEPLGQQVLTTWTTDQGLPQNFIRAITQTQDGFLWIGTMNGLVRFDGLRFRAPGPDMPAALRGNIGGLEPDAGTGLWAATGAGLFHLEHHRFEELPIAGQVGGPAHRIDALARSQSGEVWVYCDKRLYLTRNNTLEARQLPTGSLAIRDLAESKDGTLWLADGDAVFAIKDAARSDGKAIRYPLPGARMLYADAFGSVYAGDGHKLFRFAGETARPSAFAEVRNPGLGNFVGILVDHSHNLWMASGGLHGLSRETQVRAAGRGGKDRDKTRIEILTAKDGIASNDVRVLFEDRSHDVWVGTISGLQRLHRGVFTSYSGFAAGSKSQVESIFENRDGAIWAGTLESGAVRLPDDPSKPWRHFSREAGLRLGQIRGFAEDELMTSAGSMPVVAIADYGVFSFRDGRFSPIAGVPSGYSGTPVTTADGSLWFTIQRRGIFRIGPSGNSGKVTAGSNSQRTARVVQVGANEGLPADPNVVWTLALDSGGVLWAGAGNQLFRWNGNRFELISIAPSPILCMARSPRPRASRVGAGAAGSAGETSDLVVGTPDGLFFAGNRTLHVRPRLLTEEEGLPGATVVDVLEDDGDNLWIATARAIARISYAQWRAFAEGRSSRVQVEIYTRADGLRSNTVLPLNQITGIRARDGRIWWATGDGVSVLNPDADPALAPEPAVDATIDKVTVDDREQSLSDAAALIVPPGQHRITFSFTTPPVEAPEQVRFRYRLTGWDNRWVDTVNSREVSYTALPPGTYSFEVMAITRSGASSHWPAAISLRLKPFFWQTRWFLGLAILVAAVMVIEITRRRTRASAERLSFQFQERAAERERIAYQIHDTVIQDMVGTVLQLELLGFQMDEKPERASSNLGALTQRLRDTVARSRNMVWSLHSTAVVQYSLVEVLRHAEAEFRLGELPKFALSSTGEPRDIHPLVRDEVYRICREALANAFRHSNAQNVYVTVRFFPDLLEVEIGDDGDGIDDETRLHGRPGHFGLPGMQAHAQRIGAWIEIDSGPGQGTRIILRVRTQQRTWRWWKRQSHAEIRNHTQVQPESGNGSRAE